MFCFEARSHCVALLDQADLILKSLTCLCLLRAEIKAMHRHTRHDLI